MTGPKPPFENIVPEIWEELEKRAEERRKIEKEIVRETYAHSREMELSREALEWEHRDREYDLSWFDHQTWHLKTPGVRIPIEKYDSLWRKFITEQRMKGRSAGYIESLELRRKESLVEYAENLQMYARWDRQRAEDELKASPEHTVNLLREMIEKIVLDVIASGVLHGKK